VVVPAVAEAPTWLGSWADHAERVVDAPDALAALTARLVFHPGPANVCILAPRAGSLCNPESLHRLHHAHPAIRPIVMTVELLPEDVLTALADCDGGYVVCQDGEPGVKGFNHRSALLDVALDLIPADDVAIACERRGWPALRDRAYVAVEAEAPHADKPAFLAHVHGVAADRPRITGAFQAARRSAAAVASDEARREVERRQRPVPACSALQPGGQDDRWVEGDVLFELGEHTLRVPLKPAVRIETPKACVDISIVCGCVRLHHATGNVLVNGTVPRWPQPPGPILDDPPPSSYVGPWIDLRPDMVLEIDDVLTRFEVRRAEAADAR
jgi:hypothetical protein